jgi:hypothetical protein
MAVACLLPPVKPRLGSSRLSGTVGPLIGCHCRLGSPAPRFALGVVEEAAYSPLPAHRCG